MQITTYTIKTIHNLVVVSWLLVVFSGKLKLSFLYIFENHKHPCLNKTKKRGSVRVCKCKRNILDLKLCMGLKYVFQLEYIYNNLPILTPAEEEGR